MEGRDFALETDINFTMRLVEKLTVAKYKAREESRLDTLLAWQAYNARLLAEVRQLIEEAESE